MSDKNKGEKMKIPKLELESFSFSPPGPMGWSFAEYQKILDDLDGIVLDESSVKNQLSSLEGKEIIELSMKGDFVPSSIQINTGNYKKKIEEDEENQKELNVWEEKDETDKNKKAIDDDDDDIDDIDDEKDDDIDEFEHLEDEKEREKEKKRNKVKIIVSENSVKSPWMSTKLNDKSQKKYEKEKEKEKKKKKSEEKRKEAKKKSKTKRKKKK